MGGYRRGLYLADQFNSDQTSEDPGMGEALAGAAVGSVVGAALCAHIAGCPGVKTYVFSRTMRESPDPNVAIIASDAADFVRGLKSQKGKGTCVMGGGELARSLFEAHLIDEVGPSRALGV